MFDALRTAAGRALIAAGTRILPAIALPIRLSDPDDLDGVAAAILDEIDYHDPRRAPRACDECGTLYQGPAAHCSRGCALRAIGVRTFGDGPTGFRTDPAPSGKSAAIADHAPPNPLQTIKDGVDGARSVLASLGVDLAAGPDRTVMHAVDPSTDPPTLVDLDPRETLEIERDMLNAHKAMAGEYLCGICGAHGDDQERIEACGNPDGCYFRDPAGQVDAPFQQWQTIDGRLEEIVQELHRLDIAAAPKAVLPGGAEIPIPSHQLKKGD